MTSEFWAGGGEMGAHIRAYDWADSSLGLSEHWPQSLQITVRLILNSIHPMAIWWGSDLIQFHNDAAIPLMESECRPSALASSARKSCADIWDIVGPPIEHVMAGKGSTWARNWLVPAVAGDRQRNTKWHGSYAPIDIEGGIGGVFAIYNEETAQQVETARPQDHSPPFTKLFDQSPNYLAILRGPDHVLERVNPAYMTLFGKRDLIGKPLRTAPPEIVSQEGLKLLDEAYRTGKVHFRKKVPVIVQPEKGGPLKHLFLDSVIHPIAGENGKILGIFVAGVDVTDHVLAEQHLLLMNAELQHRVKNTLSIVDGIVSQTLHHDLADATFETFQDRLRALGRAQDILTAASQTTASIRDVVENALAPHRTGSERISVSGPRIIVGSKQALSLGMAIHEMATNAIKYGALSNDLGRVDVSWRLETENGIGVFHFQWQESGGPPVARPSRKGFGSGLIEGGLAWDFSGRVAVSYEPSGFICQLTTPMENLGCFPPESVSQLIHSPTDSEWRQSTHNGESPRQVREFTCGPMNTGVVASEGA